MYVNMPLYVSDFFQLIPVFLPSNSFQNQLLFGVVSKDIVMSNAWCCQQANLDLFVTVYDTLGLGV